MSTKITPIVRGNMTTLRADATKALQDVMSKHGLKVNVGRIVFEPGKEFRCKLTVMQPAANTIPNVPPKVGESWKFGRHVYRIVNVDYRHLTKSYVLGARMSNTKRWGLIERKYRIPAAEILASGVKVSK